MLATEVNRVTFLEVTGFERRNCDRLGLQRIKREAQPIQVVKREENCKNLVHGCKRSSAPGGVRNENSRNRS